MLLMRVSKCYLRITRRLYLILGTRTVILALILRFMFYDMTDLRIVVFNRLRDCSTGRACLTECV